MNSKKKSEFRKKFFRDIKKYRQEYQDKLQQIHNSISDNLNNTIKNHPGYKPCVKILAYEPLPSELPVLSFLDNSDYSIYLPQVTGNMMKAVAKNGHAENFVDIDLIVTPGLLVNTSGFRLGRGGGFYDRALVNVNRENTIFICYEWQVSESIPVDVWDVPVGYIITPNSVIKTFETVDISGNDT